MSEEKRSAVVELLEDLADGRVHPGKLAAAVAELADAVNDHADRLAPVADVEPPADQTTETGKAGKEKN